MMAEMRKLDEARRVFFGAAMIPARDDRSADVELALLAVRYGHLMLVEHEESGVGDRSSDRDLRRR